MEAQVRMIRLTRAWACYWLMMALCLLPRSWQFAWPIWPLSAWLLRYGGWWALRQNPNLPDALARQMRGK